MDTMLRPLPLENLRTHCVSVRLNNYELVKLNEERKQFAKGEWLRMCFIKNQPTVVPEINQSAWKTFGEINQRLNEILNHLNARQSYSPLTQTELFVVKRQISELRSRLLSNDIWGDSSS
ncbi:hypothetical protein [Erwinia amylovora]|uniref:hypothetical protein n=1 Tax=Erwinia amylovora TaxID=552 RepID=UPI0014441068|nr:hypothetical protein [Erwinia amylovora]